MRLGTAKLALAGLLCLGCLFGCAEGMTVRGALEATRATPTVTVAPEPTPSPIAALGPSVAPTSRIVRGVASTYGPGYAGYLALPEGRGIEVRVCGEAACIIRTSNDAGPALHFQRPPHNRIVDLNVKDFETVGGVTWRRGLIYVTVEYLP